MTKVTKDMTIGEIRSLSPRTNEVMNQIFGPGCFQCPNSKTKTIEFGAQMHGKDVDKVVEDLNRVLEESRPTNK